MELAAAGQAGFVSKKLVERVERGVGELNSVKTLVLLKLIYGTALEKLEDEKGNVLRFLTGRSANCGDCLDRKSIMKTGSLMTSLLFCCLRVISNIETSEIYSISSALVQFISASRSIFHTRAHDDVCTGSWLGFM
ncbi:beta-1,3-galactosyltransferase [Salix suchowensis]|nr:beta-1,3-galactosyltransferase [Salix suchowensis]